MISVQDLPDEYRSGLRADFVSRMERTNNSEWRKFWATEVLFLDDRRAEAVSKLHELTGSEELDVALAAWMSLGEWYEQSGPVALAREAYATVIERDPAGMSAVLARAKLGCLYNDAHEPALAAAVLESAAASIETVAPDAVQFVVTEYCRALRDLGRVDDARTFVRRAIGVFPDRRELPLLEQHLLDASLGR